MSAKPYASLALLTDLDGTLLTPEKTVSAEDAAAIAEFREKGGRFSFATGRSLHASQEFITLLQPDFPAVLYNGALIYDPKTAQTSGETYLPAEAAPLLSELMQQFPTVGAEVLCPEGIFTIQDNEYEREHLRVTHIPMILRDFREIETTRCFKALFAGAPAEIDRMIRYVDAAHVTAVSFTRSHRTFLEILPLDTNKGTALKKLRAMLPAGVQIGATGDFDNDIAMLETADFCGCPADAQTCVQDAVAAHGGFRSGKTCAGGFFADWIGAFTRKFA